MLKWLEKWALQRLLKRVAKKVPLKKEQLKELWTKRSEEIFEKVCKAVEDTVTNILTAKKG